MNFFFPNLLQQNTKIIFPDVKLRADIKTLVTIIIIIIISHLHIWQADT